MRDIENFVNDILGDLEDRIQEFLEKRDREYQERARMGVVLSEDLNGYRALIGGHCIYIEHNSSWHKWYFKDENYHTFLELSEKKGEAVLQFLQELAKVLSSRASAASEENIAKDPHEEIIGKGPLDPAAESEEIFEDTGVSL